MIVQKTFSATHFWNFMGQTGLEKRERLREKAEEFIANRINEEDIVNIAESGDRFASSVTIWYRKR